MCRVLSTSGQWSFIKTETLRGKNPTKSHGTLNEVCGEFTVHCRMFSRGANHFHSGCVSTGNDNAFQEHRHATCEELSRAT